MLRARDAPVIAVIGRGPSKLFHLIKWNTEQDKLEHGSWFSGKLYPMRCDLSFDGKWMVYLAMGDNGETWNGGDWRDAKTLMRNNWSDERGQVPFATEPMNAEYGEDEGMLYPAWNAMATSATAIIGAPTSA